MNQQKILKNRGYKIENKIVCISATMYFYTDSEVLPMNIMVSV